MRTFLKEHAGTILLVSIILFLVFSGATILAASRPGVYVDTTGFTLLVVGEVLATIFWCAFYKLYAARTFAQAKFKPRVRVWERNGITGVAAEMDYQIWWKLRELIELQEPEWQKFPRKSRWERPCPTFTAYFTDKSSIPNTIDFRAGTMDDFAKLVRGCQIERSELFIPIRNHDPSDLRIFYGIEHVGIEGIWRLVHGPDAKPPQMDSGS